MFADLKEYQDLTRIYNESVNISEEERQLQNFIEEENFTLEELQFCVENFEEVCSLEFNEDYLIESNLNEEELHEILGAIGRKLATTLGKKAITTSGGKITGIVGQKAASGIGKKSLSKGFKSFKKGGSNLLTKAGDKVKNIVSKVSKSGIGKRLKGAAKGALGAIKKGGIVLPASIVAGGISGYLAGGQNKGKTPDTPKTPEPPKVVTPPTTPEPPKGGGKEGAPKTPETPEPPKVTAPDKKPDAPKTPEPPKAKSTKPMSKIEFQNRKRFGDKHVDHLKKKNKAFQAMKRGEITKQQFIDDFPKSQTAKRYNMSDKAYRDYKKGLKKEEFAKAYQSMYKQPENNIQEETQEVNEVLLPVGLLGGLAAKKLLSKKGKGGEKLAPAGGKVGKAAGKVGKAAGKVGKAAAKGAARFSPGVAIGVAAAKGAKKLASAVKGGGEEGAKKVSGREKNLSRTKAKNAPAGARRVAMRKQFREEMEQYGYDTYDLILEYLLQTEQVSTLEEANYVMTEMDGETINEILDEFQEGFIDSLKAGASKVGGLAKKGVDAVKSAAGNVKDKVVKRVERRKENVAINKRIKEKQSGADANSGRTKAQVMALNRKKEKLNNPKEYARKQAMSGREKAQAMAKARIAAKAAKK